MEIEGADRWSLVSVRGSRQAAAVVPAGKWAIDGADGSIRLQGRTVRPGQYLRYVRAYVCTYVRGGMGAT